MTNPFKISLASALALAFAASAAAQPPARPIDAPRSVTLSLIEYNRLLDLANRPAPPPTTPPVGAVLGNANMRVRVNGDTVSGVFAVTGEVLRAGINRVSVLSGATLVAAAAGNRPVPLVADGNSQAALLSGPGPFSVTLEWGAPLTFAPGRASFVLPVPPAGSVQATFDVPGDQADVHLSSGLITGRATGGGRTIVEATLDPTSATEVSWSMRDSAPVAAAREVRTTADVTTLVTLGDADVRLVALVDLNVLQGELRTIDVRLPAGYELNGISGNTIAASEQHDDVVTLTWADASTRRHQFLVSLERQHESGSFSLDTGFITVSGVQRERGEVAVEGVGTLELSAAEREGMHRIDVRELNPTMQVLTKQPILAAFRYQRTAAFTPGLAIDVTRFADAGVLAAVADSAVATTLVTTEGRALTEVSLHVRNHAQPFLRVTLPAGATIVSAEVAGQAVKPALGSDGVRVPLLSAGVRTDGAYDVSFVYVHAGTPFARKGDLQMTLPKLDIPVGIVQWEVFVPENYSAKVIDGNVLNADVVKAGLGQGEHSGYVFKEPLHVHLAPGAQVGQIVGRVTDASGAVLPGVTVVLDESGVPSRTATTGGDGRFAYIGVASGSVTLRALLNGFATTVRSFDYDEQQPQQVDFVLQVGSLQESVTVSGATPVIEKDKATPPSQNVINLQRRAAGVLPVRVDVPRAGTSHQFVKPLVVDQDVEVKFRYKRR
jgi:hypothetical protein